jgi:ATP-dependent RNA helicase DeaD
MIQTLADALAERGYDALTPVQAAVTDPALRDADLLVSAQTGSGKTVGPRFLVRARRSAPRVRRSR